MRFHAFQHHPAENLGYISCWIAHHGLDLKITHPYSGQPMPPVDDMDCLILLGAPMGVYEETSYPWITQEKLLLKKAMAQNKKILGICFGAQMLASVLGAKVYPHVQKEIGWFPIELTPQGRNSALKSLSPSPFTVFHWHGDTFDLPTKALHLASSAACPHQAFSHGDNILGLQFHPEISEDIIRDMAHDEKKELLLGTPYVQTEEEILRHFHYDAAAKAKIFAMLDEFFLK